jgi:anti-anti-sigma regulatory factor
MLRITTHDNEVFVTLQLEGSLEGPWVEELECCWDTTQSEVSSRPVWIDLKGVTFIDHAGKNLLTALHAKGVQFVAAGCLMRAVVTEITQGLE